MENTLPSLARPVPSAFRDLVLPREHGSWSLAFEPMALGLLVAPSLPGACVAAAFAAGFFARRPLRIALQEQRLARRAAARRALATCAALGTAALGAAVAFGGVAWLVWLAPIAALAAVFAWFDLRGDGREEVAEVAGAGAFALVPAALAALAGWPPAAALALGLVMLSRSVPSVLGVRAYLRTAKSGRWSGGLALATTAAALLTGLGLRQLGLVPAFASAALVVLTVRACGLLVFPRPALRARTLGMIEAILGLGFVVGLAATWPN